jgi:hypothetical protein
MACWVCRMSHQGGTVIGTSTESDLAAAIANLHP